MANWDNADNWFVESDDNTEIQRDVRLPPEIIVVKIRIIREMRINVTKKRKLCQTADVANPVDLDV